ncbi:MAG: GIY-YIG nuclease family protein [Candidatus Shapirobacteria bacterium]|jgi:putative endonuclease
MYYVYILKSIKTREFYKGITNDLNRRLLEHNSGKNMSTRNKKPWKMVYYEECSDRIEARKKEKYFKSGFGRELLKNF